MYPTIIFFDSPHTYWHNEIQVPSVGSYIKKVEPKFDRTYWLTHGVFKEYFEEKYKKVYSKAPGLKPDIFSSFFDKYQNDFFAGISDLENTWTWVNHSASWKGTDFHKKQEERGYSLGYVENPFTNQNSTVFNYEKHYDNESITDNLSSLEDGCYLELLVYDLDLNIAGQADQVFIETIDGIRYIDVNDHKSNRKRPSKSSPDKFREPLEHLPASKHHKYILQISTYAFILAQYGFKPRNLAYTWFKNYNLDNNIIVNIPYLEKEVKELLTIPY